MQLYPRVVKEVEESPEGPQIGAFFDFDGTIIFGYSATKFLREQIKRGDVKFSQLPELLRIMTKFGLGSIDFSAMMTETSGTLKGIEEQEYLQFGEELYLNHLAKLIYPESRALIEAHLKKGHTVGLVSAATPYQVIAAARDLRIPHVMCTQLEVKDGRFTGEVIHPTCYGEGKVAAAEKIVHAAGIDPSQSYFYTDSDEDIQLLEYVGKPRPLNPNSRLRSIARGRGWPVQQFSSRGKTGVKDYVRTFALQGSMVLSAAAGVPVYALTRSMRKTRNFSTSLFADLGSAIAGLNLDVSGEENMWTNRPCVFVFNHQSQADVLIIGSLVRRDMAGVGKKEIANVPILGKLFELAGTVLIDRENAASAVEAMQPLVDAMRNEGRSVCIAPEGTRSTSTNLGRFKKGAFHLAMQAGVPMVPIVIHNAIDVSPRGQFVFRPATVKVTVLPAVDTSDWRPETVAKHVESVRDMFLIELDQMQFQQPAREPESRSSEASIKGEKEITSRTTPAVRSKRTVTPANKKVSVRAASKQTVGGKATPPKKKKKTVRKKAAKKSASVKIKKGANAGKGMPRKQPSRRKTKRNPSVLKQSAKKTL